MSDDQHPPRVSQDAFVASLPAFSESKESETEIESVRLWRWLLWRQRVGIAALAAVVLATLGFFMDLGWPWWIYVCFGVAVYVLSFIPDPASLALEAFRLFVISRLGENDQRRQASNDTGRGGSWP
jgi:hypothetical protein